MGLVRQAELGSANNIRGLHPAERPVYSPMPGWRKAKRLSTGQYLVMRE
ncbi:hypothetical protein CGLO_00356 [Colletotrichum gloeosporioides Cg-14]|uniref:Uncharacterized protein n=1 Tax=Colletotrichum gloeosporioides (strain Cg-14) TaxID=1237896 RepID=T0M712_COLGC|nr:hypothetical protein CGLO_00356 [Colletotrichum gloeosporioides Cg-14]